MKPEITDRINRLRGEMKKNNFAAYIITGMDPHGSEYPPLMWRTREWISGFTGSAGTVVITTTKACLWTDFRYWIQAEKELPDNFVLFRDGKSDTPSIAEWLVSELEPGSICAVDGRTVTAHTVSEWLKVFDNNLILDTETDLPGRLWTDRPGLPQKGITILSEKEAGASRRNKLHLLRETLVKKRIDYWIGISLDSCAWLLNVRGFDVPYNPVVAGFIIFRAFNTSRIDSYILDWFTDKSRLTEEQINIISPSHNSRSLNQTNGIFIKDYNDFFKELGRIAPDSRILIDSNTVTQAVLDNLPESSVLIMDNDPVTAMKAVKNGTEIENTRRAMEKDGVALVRFFIKLEKIILQGKTVSETEAAGLLRKERESIDGFIDESFAAVSAFSEHGAICHYEAEKNTALMLKKGSGLFLIDSGGQWREGTTDITRTISMGSPVESQKLDYTRTLKGHIALASARFPAGTRGYQLDTLARMYLWQDGIDYGHGSGHGVGYRLNVHEGPQRISPAPVDVAIEKGMIVSDEPGVYREGEYGIRIENLLLCIEDVSTDFGDFLKFETLSLFPYDTSLILWDMLGKEEVEFIRNYHSMVYNRLSPYLDETERKWLLEKTGNE